MKVRCQVMSELTKSNTVNLFSQLLYTMDAALLFLMVLFLFFAFILDGSDTRAGSWSTDLTKSALFGISGLILLVIIVLFEKKE
jgi:hypothetical protein